MRELSDALSAITGSRSNAGVIRDMAGEVVEALAAKQGERAGMPADQLFGPGLALVRRSIAQLDSALSAFGQARAGGKSGSSGSSHASSSAGKESHAESDATHASHTANARYSASTSMHSHGNNSTTHHRTLGVNGHAARVSGVAVQMESNGTADGAQHSMSKMASR